MTHYKAYMDRYQCKVKEGLTKNYFAYCSIMICHQRKRENRLIARTDFGFVQLITPEPPV